MARFDWDRLNLPSQQGKIENWLTLIFFRPERFVDTGHVFHFSGDPQLVWMLGRPFGGFRRILT